MKHDGPERFEQWLDGGLAGDERADFERALREDPRLARELRSQQALDSSLQRLFSPPDLSGLTRELAGTAAAPAPPVARPFSPFLSIAAAVLLYFGAGLWVFGAIEHRPPPTTTDWTDAYLKTCGGWYRPVEVHSCSSPLEAPEARRFGLPFGLRTDPEVSIVGPLPEGRLGSATGIRAVCGGSELMLTVSPLEDDPHPAVREDSGLFLHRATAGGYVMYELSPLAEPRLLPLLDTRAKR